MKSRSPFGEDYDVPAPAQAEEGLRRFLAQASGRSNVVIMGLGFVGAAMLAAVARARTPEGAPRYNALGVDLGDEKNFWKVGRVNSGIPPVVATDASLDAAYRQAREVGNLYATASPEAYAHADVVVVDIHLDIHKVGGDASSTEFNFDAFSRALRTVAERIRPDALVIIETTVPPGTTEKVVGPILREVFEARGLRDRTPLLAHSYERVMPGPSYLDSVVRFFRVFAGINPESSRRARAFLESVIATQEFPLSELASPAASEMAKVLENSFRAANIAFIQEWTEFAETAGVNLFEVIEAIRKRPTHRNIMQPGFGVGGYCLTKDALLADWAFRNLYSGPRRLDASVAAIRVNDHMPEHSVRLLRGALGQLEGKQILLLGVSYLNDVADTRFSPSEFFATSCEQAGARVLAHDPLVAYWSERSRDVATDLAAFREVPVDAVVFAVRHRQYLSLTADQIASCAKGIKVVLDAQNVVTDVVAAELARRGISVIGVGKGHWRTWHGR